MLDISPEFRFLLCLGLRLFSLSFIGESFDLELQFGSSNLMNFGTLKRLSSFLTYLEISLTTSILGLSRKSDASAALWSRRLILCYLRLTLWPPLTAWSPWFDRKFRPLDLLWFLDYQLAWFFSSSAPRRSTAEISYVWFPVLLNPLAAVL